VELLYFCKAIIAGPAVIVDTLNICPVFNADPAQKLVLNVLATINALLAHLTIICSHTHFNLLREKLLEYVFKTVPQAIIIIIQLIQTSTFPLANFVHLTA
jgi:hypothetical protein